MGFFGDWFGGIGNTLTRTLILVVVTVIVLCLVFVCLSACIRLSMSQCVRSASTVMVQLQVPVLDWVFPFNDSDIV